MPRSQLTWAVHCLRRAACADANAGPSDRQLLTAFIQRRDEVAFETLVRRHGPMVLGVCRRVLGNAVDAEDAFQATFLVLIQKAAAILQRDLLANWLHGVAHTTAVRARVLALKRHARERQVFVMPDTAAAPAAEDLWRDLQPLLDRELARLPEKYRIPVVLCDLEGKTQREAARQLGWPQGTVAGRLARARSLLARRLARHGLAVTGGGLAGLLAQQQTSAAVPMAMVSSTVQVAALLVAGQTLTSGSASIQVAALTQGVLKAMLIHRLKLTSAVLLAVLLACGAIHLASDGLFAAGQEGPGQQARPLERATPPRPNQTKALLQGSWMLVGRVEGGKRQEYPEGAGVTLIVSPQDLAFISEPIDPLGTTRQGTRSVYRYRIDTATTPGTIDLLLSGKDEPFLKGIYKVENDRLSLCWSLSTQRPTEFIAKAGSQRLLTDFMLIDLRAEVRVDETFSGSLLLGVGVNSESGLVGNIECNDNDRIALAVTELGKLKERVAWSKRMFQKGYLSAQQLELAEARLHKAETALDEIRREAQRQVLAGRDLDIAPRNTSSHVNDGKATAKLTVKVYAIADLVGAQAKDGGSLIQVIIRTIEPSSWNETGGVGTIEYFAEGKSLVVSQTTEVQQRVQALLEELRKAKGGEERRH